MANTITGSAKDIYKLICDAFDMAADDQKNILNYSQKCQLLCDTINKKITIDFAKNAFSFKTLKNHMYAKTKKACKEGDEEKGFPFSMIYMNTLSKYVHGKEYVEKFGVFTGSVTSIMDEIKQVPENEGFNQLGIIGVTDKLSESVFEPLNCMREIKHHLYFMGILGSKWVEDISVFREFLSFIESKNGTLKFLLINPTGEGFKQLKTMRGEALSDNSTSIFNDLSKEFKCLEVRFYDHVPCFRLMFIDNEKLALSRFKLDSKGYFQSEQGWNAPHLIIDANSFYSLFDPFMRYYEQMWQQAKQFNFLNQ